MTDRGTSTTLSYVLALAIATLLVGGLVFAGSTFVEDRREQVIRQELRVIGEHVAGDVQQVDRYAQAADSVSTARVRQSFPRSVTGSSYTMKLRDGSPATLYLNATQPDVRVAVEITTQQPVASESVASGGPVVATCDTGASPCELEIDNG